jgi:hypothetical protein
MDSSGFDNDLQLLHSPTAKKPQVTTLLNRSMLVAFFAHRCIPSQKASNITCNTTTIFENDKGVKAEFLIKRILRFDSGPTDLQ